MFYAVLFFLLFFTARSFGENTLICVGDATALLLDNSTVYNNGVAVRGRLFLTAAANGQADLAEKLAANAGALNETDPANGNNALLAAILSGYPNSINWLLESGINIKHINKNFQNALHLSAKTGYADLSDTLISKGLSVSGRDRAGNTPLLYASASHNPQTVAVLLKRGATPVIYNNDNLTPLAVSALIGNTANVALLLEAGASADGLTPCGTPLGIAVKMKNRLIFDKLLEYRASPAGIDLDGNTPLHFAAAADTDMAQTLLNRFPKSEIDKRNSRGETPLFIAMQNGNTVLVKLLLSKGADIFASDLSGNTPISVAPRNMTEIINEHLKRLENESLMLFAAVAENNIARVKLLLREGAKADSVDRQTGNTPLFTATANNFEEILSLLASNGGSVNHRNRLGNTPLMVSVATGDDNLIETLLSLGSDPNIRNNNGETALLWAAKLNRETAVQVLLAGNADPNIKSHTGVTPIKISESEGFDEITKLLKAFGAF
ncbi:MAG: ankyrin repeat domain-containing protein [Deferribacteraceae bacterium]|jgi:ankyrin repeat protein|nr:ankyrin repeat domain-containing protein [Deferribacteraceae bacterium]